MIALTKKAIDEAQYRVSVVCADCEKTVTKAFKSLEGFRNKKDIIWPMCRECGCNVHHMVVEVPEGVLAVSEDEIP